MTSRRFQNEPSPTRLDREGGFTLVEALVAFMIVALTLTMGLQALADGALWARRGPEQADRLDEAVSVINGILADAKLRPGMTDGHFADGEVWRARVTDVTASLAPHAKTALLRIELFTGPEAQRQPLLVTMSIGR